MIEFLPLIIAVLVIVNIILVLRLSRSGQAKEINDLKSMVSDNNRIIGEQFRSLKEEFAANRTEYNANAKAAREEMSDSVGRMSDIMFGNMKSLSDMQKSSLSDFSKQLELLRVSNESKLENIRNAVETQLEQFKDKIDTNAKADRSEAKSNFEALNKEIKESFTEIVLTQKETAKSAADSYENTRRSVEHRLDLIREDNGKKLEQMRETVDEKLHKTLETRLGQSFGIVSDKLELVQKGLGEMQSLAVGVGDLKKVLTNVKSRGMIGEYQLENILEQILTSSQYDKNVKTNPEKNCFVEFAVKLPGKIGNSQIYLPIDSKFPIEDYRTLCDAYDMGDSQVAEKAFKIFADKIKSFARDIRDKYIAPPYTTDFAIMFLPVEGIYAEVLRNAGLFDTLQKEYRVIVTGPATLSAFLNSLQMGFRTLAVEKRSSEVWNLLSAVKAEFGKFGDLLDKTEKKLNETGNVIKQAGIRSRAIERKLKNVDELPEQANTDILNLPPESKKSE